MWQPVMHQWAWCELLKFHCDCTNRLCECGGSNKYLEIVISILLIDVFETSKCTRRIYFSFIETEMNKRRRRNHMPHQIRLVCHWVTNPKIHHWSINRSIIWCLQNGNASRAINSIDCDPIDLPFYSFGLWSHSMRCTSTRCIEFRYVFAEWKNTHTHTIPDKWMSFSWKFLWILKPLRLSVGK